jgi:hypothetical protein
MTKKRDPRILFLLAVLGPAVAAVAAAAEPGVLPSPSLAAYALLLWVGLPVGMVFLAFRDFWKRIRPFPYTCGPLGPETLIPLLLGSVFVSACVCTVSAGLYGYTDLLVRRVSECQTYAAQETDRIRSDRPRDLWLDQGLRTCGKTLYRYGLSGREPLYSGSVRSRGYAYIGSAM